VMKKRRLPSLVVLVRGTNRSPCSAKRRQGRLELSATVQAMLLKLAGPVSRTQAKVSVATVSSETLAASGGRREEPN